MSPGRCPPRALGTRGAPARWPLLGVWVCALLLAAAGSDAGDQTFVGTVSGVWSGDTLLVRQGVRERPIRLLGIDAPEADQPFAALARSRTAELALGGQVTVVPVREDPRGRTVGVVRLPDGRDLGRELVAAGLARWDRAGAPDARGLEAAEAAARAAGRGMWHGSAEGRRQRP